LRVLVGDRVIGAGPAAEAVREVPYKRNGRARAMDAAAE